MANGKLFAGRESERLILGVMAPTVMKLGGSVAILYCVCVETEGICVHREFWSLLFIALPLLSVSP